MSVGRSPYRSVAVTENVRRTPRIIACCGGMVIVSGLERMTFEVLRVAREQGAAVHCIVNTWENHRFVALAEQMQASWSTGYYWYGFGRQLFNPFKLVQFLWDVLRTSVGLLKDAYQFRPTHVFLPDFVAVLRNAPALVLLRGLGVPPFCVSAMSLRLGDSLVGCGGKSFRCLFPVLLRTRISELNDSGRRESDPGS